MSYDEWEFERVSGPHEFTEGPVWDGSGIIFSDLNASEILRYDPSTDSTTTCVTGTNGGNGLKFGPDGRLYVCQSEAHRVVRFEKDGRLTIVASAYKGTSLNAPNDLAFGPKGHLWFSDPYYGEGERPLDHRSIYRVNLTSPDSINRMTTDTTQPNGLLVSPDGRRLFVAQSSYAEDEPTQLRRYPIFDDELGSYDVLHNFSPHRGIDGMAFSDSGKIVACAGWPESGPGPMIYVFSQNGRVIETHPFPPSGGKPTNCAFGDDEVRSLYVTSGEGQLFRTVPGLSGLLSSPHELHFSCE